MAKRPKPILLLVDNRARDAHGILLVYWWLRHMACPVALCNKRNWKAKWRTLTPSVVALSYTDGAGSAELLSEVAKASKIALIPQEGAIPNRDTVVLERYTGIRAGGGAFTKGVSKVFLWGRQTARWLTEAEVFTPEQVVVSGTPRLDPYMALQTAYEQLIPDRNRASQMVGFALSHGKVNIYHKRVNFLRLVDLYKNVSVHDYYAEDRNIEDYIWYQAATLRAELDIIDADSLRGACSYSLRPDAFENPEGYKYIRQMRPNVVVGNTRLLWEWLAQLSCLVTFSSTTGIEALLLDIPVISPLKLLGPRLHDHMNLDVFVNPPYLRFYWQPRTLTETLDMLAAARDGRLATSPESTGFADYVRDFYDWPRPEPSSLTIARELATLAEFDPPQERAGTLPVLSRISSGNYVAGVPRFFQDWYRAIGYRLPTISLDLAYAAFDLLGGRSRCTQRYHFQLWHRTDFRKAKRVWSALRKGEWQTPIEEPRTTTMLDTAASKERAGGE